mgnify:CR=1 FL=1
MMTKSYNKIKHQVKSNKYYVFWGACTIGVLLGQIYVGNGYRRMAESNDAISADINLLVEVLAMPMEREFIYEPLVPPPSRMPIICLLYTSPSPRDY